MWFWEISLLSLSISTVSILGLKVNIEIDPETFYLNNKTIIRCSASDFSQITSLQLRLNEGASEQRTGCLKGGPDWTGIDNIFKEDLISGSDCETAVQSTPAIITLQPTITEQLRGDSLSCYAYDGTEEQTTAVVVDNIREPPRNLELTISGVEPKVVERKEFTFECTSSGSDPSSIYSYEVIRTSDDTVVSRTNTYTPASDDRDGLTLKCTDTVHTKWPVQEDINATLSRMPYFIDSTGVELTRSTQLNPTNAELVCDIRGYRITYNWTCDGCGANDNTKTLSLPKDPRTNGQVEIITCTASVESLPTVTIAWNVTWSNDATTPPPPVEPSSETPTPSPSTGLSGGAIGGITGGAIGLILIVIVIISCFVCRSCPGYNKLRSGGSGGGGKNPENGETMKMRGAPQSQSGMPGKPKHQNSKKQPKSKAPAKPSQPPAQPHRPEYQDDKILYADLDHSVNPVKPVTKNSAKSPPPQDRVEYTSIDMLKTQQQGQPQLQDSVGDEYAAIDKSKNQPPKQNGDTYENVSSKRNDRASMPKGNAPTPY